MADTKINWLKAKDGDADEIEKIVEKYYKWALKRAYYWTNKTYIVLDEAISLALMALMCCIRGNYDPEKAAFITYLTRAIDNEFRFYLRSENKHVTRCVSFDNAVGYDTDYEVTWLENIESDDIGPHELLEEKESFLEALDVIDNVWKATSENERKCLLLRSQGCKAHKDLAREMNLTCGQIQYLIRKIRNRVREERNLIQGFGGIDA